MYSRFTPGPDGVYRRRQVSAASAPTGGMASALPPNPPKASPPKNIVPPQPCGGAPSPKPMPPSLKNRLMRLLPKGMELGDLLVLLIAVVLLIESDEDMQTILITVAAFFLL